MGRLVAVVGASGYLGFAIVQSFLQANKDIDILPVVSRHSSEKSFLALSPNPRLLTPIDFSEFNETFENNVYYDAILMVHSLKIWPNQPLNTKSPNYIPLNLHEFYNKTLIKYSRLINRIIYASSAGQIYQDSPSFDELLSHSEDSRIEPTSFYGISKFAEEKNLSKCCEIAKIKLSIIRISNLFGPDFRNPNNPLLLKEGFKSLVFSFFSAFKSDCKISLYSANCSVRDYIYIRDAADIITTMVDNNYFYNQKIINLSSGFSCTPFYLYTKWLQASPENTPISLTVLSLESRRDDRIGYNIDNTKLLKFLPANFRFSLKSALSQCWEIYLRYNS